MGSYLQESRSFLLGENYSLDRCPSMGTSGDFRCCGFLPNAVRRKVAPSQKGPAQAISERLPGELVTHTPGQPAGESFVLVASAAALYTKIEKELIRSPVVAEVVFLAFTAIANHYD